MQRKTCLPYSIIFKNWKGLERKQGYETLIKIMEKFEGKTGQNGSIGSYSTSEFLLYYSI